MRDKLALAATILYYVFWPFLKLFHAITSILAPFWTIARFVLLPITYLAHTLFSIASLPFRLQLLDRIEVSPFSALDSSRPSKNMRHGQSNLGIMLNAALCIDYLHIPRNRRPNRLSRRRHPALFLQLPFLDAEH